MRTRLLSLAVIVAVNAAAAHGVPPVLTLTRAGARIVFQTNHRGIIARGGSSHVLYEVERTLADQLQRVHTAEQLMVIDRDDIHYYVVLTQEMSGPLSMGQGYCGAGEEHRLLLITSSGRTLRQSDNLLLSSCLESFEPRIPEEKESTTRAALDVDPKHDAIRFSCLGDGPDTRRILSIENGRFVLELRPGHIRGLIQGDRSWPLHTSHGRPAVPPAGFTAADALPSSNDLAIVPMCQS